MDSFKCQKICLHCSKCILNPGANSELCIDCQSSKGDDINSSLNETTKNYSNFQAVYEDQISSTSSETTQVRKITN